MEKYVDTTAEVSKGGRVWSYWRDKGVKKPFASTVNPDNLLNNNPILKVIKQYHLNAIEFGNYMSQADDCYYILCRFFNME